MPDYNKSGIASDGSIDPKRKMVSGIMHVFGFLPGDNSKLRKLGDDLYQSMVTGENVGGWKSTGGGGKDGEEEEGKSKLPPIKDIDYPTKSAKDNRKPTLGDIYRPKVKQTFNEGGLVRGAGKAERGRGRGKMV